MKPSNDILGEMTVLVVDDDNGFRKTIVEFLRGEGFSTLDTSSTSQASGWLRAGEVSLVLLDWDLRNAEPSTEGSATGLEILRTCRETHPLLPVIVMSNAPDYDARGDSMMADADSFLAKPFSLSLLSRHLRRWASRTQRQQNPFDQLAGGEIQTIDMVTRAYTRAVVDRVGSVLQAAPKLGLSRQTVTSYLGSTIRARNPDDATNQ